MNMEPERNDQTGPHAFGLNPSVPKDFSKPLGDFDPTKVVKIDRYTAIDDKLQSIVDGCPTPPAWCDAWRHSMRGRTLLSIRNQEEDASPEERLAVWQAVRDSGVLPEDAGLYLVADEIEFLTGLHIGEKLDEIDRRIDALYAEFGFEEWRSQAHWDCEDFEEFQVRCPLDWDRLYFEMLRKHGEHETGRLYRVDRKRLEERMREGRKFFHPPQGKRINAHPIFPTSRIFSR